MRFVLDTLDLLETVVTKSAEQSIAFERELVALLASIIVSVEAAAATASSVLRAPLYRFAQLLLAKGLIDTDGQVGDSRSNSSLSLSRSRSLI